jgi:hypothetical protein
MTEGAGAKIIVAGPEGPGLFSNATSGGMSLATPSEFKTWTNLTLYYRGYQHTAPDLNSFLFAINYADSDTAPYCAAAIYYDGNLNTDLTWNSGGTNLRLDGPAAVVGKLSMAGVFPVGGTAYGYKDGVKWNAGQSFGASIPNYDSTSLTEIATYNGVAVRKVNATCYAAYIWDRILTDNELAYLDNEPYCFLYYPHADIPIKPISKFSIAANSFLLDKWPQAAAAYSFRKLRDFYSGNAVRIRRSSDNAEQDIGFTVDGNFDTGAANSFLNGSTGYITKWYDQSGHGVNLTQTTTANQPTYSASGLSNKPTMTFDGSNDALSTDTNAVSVGNTNMLSNYAVADFSSSRTDANQYQLASYLASGAGVDYNNDASAQLINRTAYVPQFQFYRNDKSSNGTNYTLDVPFIAGVVFDGSYGTCYKNDATSGSSAAISAVFGSTGTIRISGNGVGQNIWIGSCSEFVMWPTSLNHIDIDTAINTYYGIH